MSEDSPIIAAGLRVGEYVLDAKIGEGAFGEVWRAHHGAWTDQLAAVKIPTDPTYLRHLHSEGFSLHRLNHPNIVKVLGFDPAASPPYLVTELVNGPSLRELLKDGRLPMASVVAIMRQVLTGLGYAHQNGVVHGDLKPENVLVDQSAANGRTIGEGTIKLTDFGVGLVAVTAALGGGSSSRLLSAGRSSSSGGVATVAYIAPEQREGSAADARCDLFACGVMLFELLTGERPAGAESPSDFNADVPPAMDAIFRRAYARRDRRFSSAAEFLSAIEGAVATAPGPKPAAAAPPSVAAIAPSRRPEAESDIIGLRPDDEDQSTRVHRHIAPPPPTPVFEVTPAAVPAPAAPAAQPTPVIPPIRPPHVAAHSPAAAPGGGGSAARPPRSQRTVIIMDEMARKPLRTAEELRETFGRIYLSRALDQGEIANLRIRLDQWAESVGGLPGFGDRVEIVDALDCPYHRVQVTTNFEPGKSGPSKEDTVEEGVILANPSASQDCGRSLATTDFSPFIHVSTGVFPIGVLEMVNAPVMRLSIANLLSAAKAQAGGRPIVRQELKVSRATVLSMKYSFETTEQGVCFVGTSLKVVATTAPLTRMRDELLKRAAALLDTANVGAGISELRQMFLTPNPAQPRAERMLVAFRAKLSAAYLSLAKATMANMGAFESLTYSRRALSLLPTSEEVPAHEARVQRMAFWLHFGPGLVIGLIFAILASINMAPLSYCAAAIGAIVAGIYCWIKLRTTPARTDVAFVHACLFPLAVSAILATTLRLWSEVVFDISAAVLVAGTFFLDWMIFNKYGDRLLRPMEMEIITGDPMEVLNQIQTLLEPDWEKLREHYLELEPLYKHASAQIVSAEPAPREKEEAPSDELGDLGDEGAGMSGAVLSVVDLRKEYGTTLAVDGVSFDVAAGEIVGLLGPNGAGKTTLINMILSVLLPTAGSISVEGIDLAVDRTGAISRTNFAAVYAPLPGNLTVRQNLRVFGLMYEVRNLRQRIEELLEQYDLRQFANTRCGVLSSGEQTRVSLAKAMLNRPHLLLLDEPTASLDPSSAHDIRARIRDFTGTCGGGVLWTSHNMQEVHEVCDRVLFLSHGKILLQGDPKTLPGEHGKRDLEELFIAVAREPLTLEKG